MRKGTLLYWLGVAFLTYANWKEPMSWGLYASVLVVALILSVIVDCLEDIHETLKKKP